MASITKRTTGDGQRRYDVRYRTPAGQVRTKTFKRSEDARRYVSTVEADLLRGEWVDPRAGRRTFADLAEGWLAAADIKAKTHAGYRSLLDRHLLPHFGATPMGAVTTADVEQYLAELRTAGTVSPNTARNIRNALSAVCRYAARCGVIKANPVTDVAPTKGTTKREMLFLTAAQVAALADAIDPRYRLPVLLTAFTGLRAGEMEGLKVGRVDLMRRRLHIVETLSEVHGALVTTTPKHDRTRAVPVPRFLVDELAVHMAPVATDADAYVFTAPHGGPIRHGLFYRRYFKPAAAAIGVPDLRWHDLRHTAVALMVSAGVEPLVISRVLGHGSIAITYDVYGHVLPGLEEHLADAMDAIYTAAAPSAGVVRAMDAR